MKKMIFLTVWLFSVTACKTAQAPPPTETIQEERMPYFKGNGNEPFWNISISEDAIRFESLLSGFESVTTPAVASVRAMDANVKMYRAHTESIDIQIQIEQTECVNSMSGAASPYAVTIEIKRKTDKDATILKGCGAYLTDYRLYDIWALEQLNGRKATLADFGKELPIVEINSQTNTFMGFAGCNQMNGRLFYEKSTLRFTNITTTRMACGPKNKEGEFLKALQSTTGYEIKNNRLWLSNPSGLLLVLKKID